MTLEGRHGRCGLAAAGRVRIATLPTFPVAAKLTLSMPRLHDHIHKLQCDEEMARDANAKGHNVKTGQERLTKGFMHASNTAILAKPFFPTTSSSVSFFPIV